MTNTELVGDVEELVRWMRENPTLEAPNSIRASIVFVGVSAKQELAEYARAMGSANKYFGDEMFSLTKDVGVKGAVEIVAIAHRETVCTRRVVRVEEVPERVVPAHNREIVEWDCGSVLAPATESSTAETVSA